VAAWKRQEARTLVVENTQQASEQKMIVLPDAGIPESKGTAKRFTMKKMANP
jgi:hypothetical protein